MSDPLGYCERCGEWAPCRSVTFHQNVGVLIVRFPRTLSGHLCRTCIDDAFWKMSLISFFFGWWGVISFFYTLVTLPMNVITWLGTRSLPAPGAVGVDAHARTETPPPQRGIDVIATIGLAVSMSGLMICAVALALGVWMIVDPRDAEDPVSGVTCFLAALTVCGLPALLAGGAGLYRLSARCSS